MVIFISERYTRLAKLIGRGNPIATLATLILLSYTKYLRAIIDIFSFAILKYPDDSVRVVWLPDATVRYLSGKHQSPPVFGGGGHHHIRYCLYISSLCLAMASAASKEKDF